MAKEISKATRLLRRGRNKGQMRIFLQGAWLREAGFFGGRLIDVTFEQGKVTIALSKEGKRHVSGKFEGAAPVIDLLTAELACLGTDELQMTIEKAS